MKRWGALFMGILLTLTLAGCGSGASGSDTDPDTGTSGTGTPDQESGESAIESSLELLETVWDSYGDDEKFSVAGGDMSEENATTDAPGVFSLDDTDALDATLGFPPASVDKIDDAASLVHMMNANTFTCGAFHVKEGGESADVLDAIKENIMTREWLCGFPDKLVIAQVDDYIVSFFGASDLVETFKTKLTGAYASAEIVCDEPIA